MAGYAPEDANEMRLIRETRLHRHLGQEPVIGCKQALAAL